MTNEGRCGRPRDYCDNLLERAEAAEAALERVRTLADHCGVRAETPPYKGVVSDWYEAIAADIRAALDPKEDQ